MIRKGVILLQKKTRLLLAVLCLLLAAAAAAFFLFRSPAKASPLKGKTLLLAGDSRSSTDYDFYQRTLEQKTGSTVLVEGASGKTAAYNASDEYLDRVFSLRHDFSLWLVGGNDDGSPGTIGTFSPDSPLAREGESVVEPTDVSAPYAGATFIQAIDHIMRRYKASGSQSGSRMVFCTDLPQQRDDPASPWSLRENWERKRLAILECCEKNQIPCLDLYTLCGFDMGIEPMFHAPTDTRTNRGVYYMDGLHPNPKGIDLITGFEVDLLEKLIQE